MRPLRLELEAFACFRQPQVVDFSGLSLFSVSGPTGAGKSSLLDALVFALHGQVPRLGPQRSPELIYLGRPEARVSLTFIADEQTHRISRTISRRGTATALLERLEPEGWVARTRGLPAVRRRIDRLLGLDAETFFQVAMLPQGEFQRFLRTTGRERRSILVKLLHLDIYARMGVLARAAEAGITATYQTLVDRREQLPQAAAVDAQAEICRSLAQNLADAETEAQATHRRWDHLRGLSGLAAERAEVTQKLLQTQAEAPLWAERAEVLARARRAEPLVGPLNDLSAAEAELERSGAVLAALLPQQAAAEAQWLEQQQLKLQAQADAARLPALRAERERLVQQLVRVPERRRLLEDELRISKQVEALEARLAAEDARRAALEAQDVAARHQRTVALLAAARERRQHYEGLKSVADVDLDDLSAKVSKIEATLQRERAGWARAEFARVAAEEAAQVAQRAHLEAEQRLGAAQATRQAAERAQTAMHLRQHLVEGQPCPVCEQLVLQVPAMNTVAVDSAGVQEAEAERGRRRAGWESAQQALRTAERALASLGARIAQLEEDHGRRQQSLRAAEARVLAVLPEGPSGLRAARAEWAAYLAQVGRLEEEASTQGAQAEAVAKDHAMVLVAIEGLKERLQEQRAEATRLQQARIALGDDSLRNPEQALSELEATLTRLEQTSATAEALLGAAEARKNKIDHDVIVATEAHREAQARTRDVVEQLAALLAEAGFDTPDDVRAALRNPNELRALAQGLAAHEAQLAAWSARLAALDQSLGGSTDPEALEAARQAAGAATRRLGEQRVRLTEAEAQWAALQAGWAERQRLDTEIEAMENRRRIHQRLATDLEEGELADFLVEEALRALLQGASRHLGRLTRGRYGFRLDPDLLEIIDHERGGHSRAAETLSGGESFLAALALALELGEQVQAHHAHARIGSLFIDEGFGTLDPETLRVVSDTLHLLPQDGRLVGVITHLPELRDEFRQQIRIWPGPDGSKIEVI